MFDINKIQVCEDCILYDGDQVAFMINTSEVELGLTNEDLVGGEVPIMKRKEILDNKEAIVKEIQRLGYQTINE